MMLRRMMMAPASGGGSGGVADSILAKARLWWTFDGSLVDSVASNALAPFSSTPAYTQGKKGSAVQTLRASTAGGGVWVRGVWVHIVRLAAAYGYEQPSAFRFGSQWLGWRSRRV